MTSFAEVALTPSFLVRILHVLTSAWMVGAALMLSVSAWYLLRQKHVRFARANFSVALPFFAVLAVLQLFVFGAESAVNVVENQPAKLASMEGVWETESCASLYIVGWVDEDAQSTTGLSIPCLLSFLAYQDFDAEVTGLNAFPADVWPPLNFVFQAYHIMINLGMVFIGLGGLGLLFFFWKRRVFTTPWLLWGFVASIFLAELATLSGWWTAEFGRQPWIVYDLLRTVDAVSPNLTTSQVLASVIMFVLLYILLLVLFLYLLNEKIQHGPDPLEAVQEVPIDELPDTFRELFRASARPRADS